MRTLVRLLLAACLFGTVLAAPAGAAPDPPYKLTMARYTPVAMAPPGARGWMVANAYGTQCYLFNALWTMPNGQGRPGVQYYWCGRLLEGIVLTGSHSAWIPDDTGGFLHEEHPAQTCFGPAGGFHRGVDTDFDFARSTGWDEDVDLVAKLYADGGITGNWYLKTWPFPPSC